MVEHRRAGSTAILAILGCLTILATLPQPAEALVTSTARFEVHYDGSTDKRVDEAVSMLTQIASDLEAYFGDYSLPRLTVVLLAETDFIARYGREKQAYYKGNWTIHMKVFPMRLALGDAFLELTLYHEVVHAYQDHLSGGGYHQAPDWFVEGMADVIAFRLSHSPTRGFDRGFPGGTLDASPYANGRVALDRLIDGYGVNSLVQVFRLIQGHASFPSAFTQTYGVSPQAFEYALLKK